MLENLRSSCEAIVVRSLLRGTHMRLHTLLIDDHHDRSDMFHNTSGLQRRGLMSYASYLVGYSMPTPSSYC